MVRSAEARAKVNEGSAEGRSRLGETSAEGRACRGEHSPEGLSWSVRAWPISAPAQ